MVKGWVSDKWIKKDQEASSPDSSSRRYLKWSNRPRLGGMQWLCASPSRSVSSLRSRRLQVNVFRKCGSERSTTTLFRLSRVRSSDHFPATSSTKFSFDAGRFLRSGDSPARRRGDCEQKLKLMILAVLTFFSSDSNSARLIRYLEVTGLRMLIAFFRSSTSSLSTPSATAPRPYPTSPSPPATTSFPASSVVRFCSLTFPRMRQRETDLYLPFLMTSSKQLACAGERSFSSPSRSELPSLSSSSLLRSCSFSASALLIYSKRCLIFSFSMAVKMDTRSTDCFCGDRLEDFPCPCAFLALRSPFSPLSRRLACAFSNLLRSAARTNSTYSANASPTFAPIPAHSCCVYGTSVNFSQSKKLPLEVSTVQESGTPMRLSTMARAVVSFSELILKMQEQQRNMAVALPSSFGNSRASQQQRSTIGNSGPYIKVFFFVE